MGNRLEQKWCILAKRKSYDSGKEDKRDLHGEIRRLRKVIKVKDREIARLQKWIDGDRFPSEPVDNDEEIESDQKKFEPPKPRCTECGSEDTSPWEINAPSGLRRFIKCNKCGKSRCLNPKVT